MLQYAAICCNMLQYATICYNMSVNEILKSRQSRQSPSHSAATEVIGHSSAHTSLLRTLSIPMHRVVIRN